MLKTFIPHSALLQKYIDTFYVFSSDKPQKFSYVAFPHVNTAVSFFKGVSISRRNLEITLEQEIDNSNNTCVEILGKYVHPVFVHYNGDFEEVSIVFKPLGITHFINEDFLSVAPLYSQSFNNAKWQAFSQVLLQKHNDEDKIALLENFLLDNMVPKKNELMYEALKYLEDTDDDYSIENIAAALKINIKTFQRNFLKHMGCTALEYKRIARFRHALKSKILSSEVKSLTSLSYESNYYDQSYFIREFKKLTNLNPKKFFDAITVLDEQKIVWEIK